MNFNDKQKLGFGKPTIANQFKKEQSGNPNGRPKISSSLQMAIETAAQETVVLNENGQRKKISKREAAIKHLVNRAANGNLRALKTLLKLDSALAPQLTLLAAQRAAARQALPDSVKRKIWREYQEVDAKIRKEWRH